MNFFWGSNKPYKPESTYNFENQSTADANKNTKDQTSPNISSLFSTVVEKVKTAVVEEKKSIQQFLKEANHATDNANGERKSKAIPPWLDFSLDDKKAEEEVRNQIINLTKSRRNFTNAPPEDANFPFEYEKYMEIAQVSLEADPNLANARFYLVPKFIREPKFWRNYFYRVYIIKEAYGLNKKVPTSPPSPPHHQQQSFSTQPSNTPPVSPSSEQPSPTSSSELQHKDTDPIIVQSKDDEFVSDHLVGGNTPLESEWEDEINRELEEKLKSTDSSMEINDAWEEELKKELENSTSN